jgi:hypothetical protein
VQHIHPILMQLLLIIQQQDYQVDVCRQEPQW